MIRFVIPGRPVPWARTRTGFFTPKRQRDYMEKVAKIAALEMKRQHEEALVGPLKMWIRFDYRHELTEVIIERLNNSIYKETKPDISNLVKIIEDSIIDHNRACINRLEPCRTHAGLIHDDAQVVVLHAEKWR